MSPALLTDAMTAELPSTLADPRLNGGNLFNAMKKAIAALVADQTFRRAEAELMALDDRMLKDIGLDRSEIGSVLRDHGQERRNGAQHQRWQDHVNGE